MNKDPRVSIIGGGVNGVSSALAILQEFPNLDVTVYSDYFSPYTTADGSAGLWTPYCLPGTPLEKIIQWSEATWNLIDLWYKEKKSGVLLTTVRRVSRQDVLAPGWSQILPLGFREYTQEDLKEFGPQFISGHTYASYCAEPAIFLPSLMDTVKFMGGKFERRHLRALGDLSEKTDIIVNCSGLWSRDLVPDYTVYPIRGQVMRVQAPWLKRCTFDLSEGVCGYIIPNTETVVLGGTSQENDWRTTIDVNDTETIWKTCTSLEPELKTNAEIVSEWVGLRPARLGGVRLEEDFIFANRKTIPVVHNYGHGGSGVTTFWGCALEVKDLVGKILHRHYLHVQSKL